MKHRSYYAIFVFSFALLMTVTLRGFGGATIWTDKPDYAPGETVVISGGGFLPVVQVAISITPPDSTVDTIYVMTDVSGYFTCNYQLDGIIGIYSMTATDGTNTASTTFTDKAIFSDLYGYTLLPSAGWTKGDVKGYHEDEWVPYQIEITSSKDDSYQLTVTIHHDYYDGTYYALDDVKNWLMSRNGVPETSVTHSVPTVVGSELEWTWTFTINKDDDCILTVEAHIAIGAHNWPGASIHTSIYDITSSPDTSINQGNKDVPLTTKGIIVPSTVTVAFDQVGVGNDFGGTVLTVDGTDNWGVNDLPYTYTWTIGDSHTFAYCSPLDTGLGTRYVWTSTSGLSNLQSDTITVPDGGGLVTGHYKTQYYLAMSTNFGSVSPVSGWYNAGSVVPISATAPSVVAGEQYVWNGWTGTGTISYTGANNPAAVTMNGPVTEAASWTHQYYLTVTSLHDSPIPASGWLDAGTGITASVTSPWSGGTGIQYVCTGWAGTGSVPSSGTGTTVGFNINAPSSITWNWNAQYLVSFTQTGSAAAPTVTYAADTDSTDTVPFNVWVLAGSQVSYTYQAIVPGAAGVQYVLTGVNPTSPQTVDGPLTVLGIYKTQYYLTVLAYGDGNYRDLIPPVTPPSGWFDAGTRVTLNAPQVSLDAKGNTYFFYGIWSVNGVVMRGNTVHIIMDCPKLAIAWYCDPPVFRDLNGNGRLDFGDLVIVARHYGEVRTSSGYDSLCDFNMDGRIDLKDLAALARAIYL